MSNSSQKLRDAKIATNLKNSKKWDTFFASGAKYRDFNDVFIFNLLKKFKNQTGMKPNRVIDLGCGTGETLINFCKLEIPVTGLDFSAVALKKGKANLVSFYDKVTLIKQDLQSLDNLKIKTPPGTLWLCKFVLAFINDKKKFLQTVRKKMKTNDMLLLMTPVLHGGIDYKKEDKPGIAIDFEELENLVSSVFVDKEIFSDEYPGEHKHIISYLIKK